MSFPNAAIRVLPVPFLVERRHVAQLATLGVPVVDRVQRDVPWVQVEDPFYIRVLEAVWLVGKVGVAHELRMDVLTWLLQPENEARLRLGASARELTNQYLLGARRAGA